MVSSFKSLIFSLGFRLAQERQEAKAKKEKSTTVNTNLLEKTGVADRPVKAVPGTEVPGRRVSVF